MKILCTENQWISDSKSVNDPVNIPWKICEFNTNTRQTTIKESLELNTNKVRISIPKESLELNPWKFPDLNGNESQLPKTSEG